MEGLSRASCVLGRLVPCLRVSISFHKLFILGGGFCIRRSDTKRKKGVAGIKDNQKNPINSRPIPMEVLETVDMPTRIQHEPRINPSRRVKGWLSLFYKHILDQEKDQGCWMRIEVLLGIYEVWDVVDLGSDDAMKNNIVKGLLFQSIPEDLVLQIGNLKTKKETWEAIKTRNLGASRVKEARLQTLITKFKNMKMLDNGTINEYAAKLSALEHVLDLKTTGFEDVVGRLKANNDSSRGIGRGLYSRIRGHGRGQDENIIKYVWFGDGSFVRIKGKGSILFQGKKREQKLLKDVYYIPALLSNVCKSPYKAQLKVGKEDTNVVGQESDESRSDDTPNPFVRLGTIRLLIALAAKKGWKIHHLDVKTDFQNVEPGLKFSKAENEPEVEATQYQKIMSCLRYLLHTRSDLTYSVGMVSRYMQSPRDSHARAIKQILRYLKGTTLFGIKYNRSNDMKLVGYSDSCHNVNVNDGQSTTRHVFYLGTSPSPITWFSQKQTTVALSSCEAKFMQPVQLENQRADPLTKALARKRFKEMRSLLGVQELPSSSQKLRGGPQLDHEDLEQVDKFDLEEMDLKCSKGNQDSRRDPGNTGYKVRHNEKRPAKQDEHKAMVTIDGEGLDTEMSAKDKSGLGYGSQIHDRVLSYENKVFASVFDNRSSDVEDSPVNDRFAKVEGIHAVPPPMTENYMPLKFDFGIDESNFTHGPKQSTTSEFDAKTDNLDSCDSSSSEETLETVPKLVESKPKVVNEPKVWSDAPIIEEYESDSDDEHNSKPSKRDWNGLNSKRIGLGYGYTKKACFVCGSLSHLIRDCDFHEKRMAKQVELNKQMGKSTGQRENRPVWNNVQRLSYQNKFVPTIVLTKTGRFLINAARQILSSQSASTSTARKVNTARPIVNEIRLRHSVYKSHSPIRRPFNKTIAPKANFTQHKVNTAGDKSDNPHQTLKGKGIVDSGCSRHMTGNKSYLVDYHEFNGGPVAFGDISTACYVLNRGLVTKPQNKTPYELLTAYYCRNKANKTAGPKETNNSAGTQDSFDAGNSTMEADYAQEYILPLWSSYTSTVKSSKVKNGDEKLYEDTDLKTNEEPVDQEDQAFLEELERLKRQEKEANDAAKTLRKTLEDIYEVLRDRIFTSASYDDEGAVADFKNLETTVNGSPIPTSRIHSTHHTTQILRDSTSAVQTRSKVNKIIKPMLLNKKDERGVVVRNKARLVTQGHRQEEGIEYDEVFVPVARIDATRIFLAFDSYMGFIVYQMDVKSAFLYGKIDEEVYMKGLIDQNLFIKKDKKDITLVQVYVDDIIFGSTKKSWCDEFEALMKNSVKIASTPIETKKPLVKDEEAANVTPKTSHLQAVKRIFSFGKRRFGKKESVSKQGKKKDKTEPTLDDNTFDANIHADHGMDYMDIKEPVNKGRLSEETEELVTTARLEDSTVRPDIKEEKAKEKGVSIKDIENSSRPARSILTLKPLLTIDPKDKGKGVLEEQEPVKKMTRSDLDAVQIAKDAEVARLVYEEELAELERKKEKRQRGV
nr:uncharacterized mitochondrial protein AtMg00810-like [Tanacetum cinerariifolium]